MPRIYVLAILAAAVLILGCGSPSPAPANPLNEYTWLRLEQLKGEAIALATALTKQSEVQLLESIKSRTADKLKDPESARFKNLRFVDYKGGKLICGEVNAKNSYGGYVGFAPFLATLDHIAIVGDVVNDSPSRSVNMSLLNAGCGS